MANYIWSGNGKLNHYVEASRLVEPSYNLATEHKPEDRGVYDKRIGPSFSIHPSGNAGIANQPERKNPIRILLAYD